MPWHSVKVYDRQVISRVRFRVLARLTDMLASANAGIVVASAEE